MEPVETFLIAHDPLKMGAWPMTLWLLGHRDLQDAGYPHEPYL